MHDEPPKGRESPVQPTGFVEIGSIRTQKSHFSEGIAEVGQGVNAKAQRSSGQGKAGPVASAHPPSQEVTVSRPWRNAGVLRSLGEGGPELRRVTPHHRVPRAHARGAPLADSLMMDKTRITKLSWIQAKAMLRFLKEIERSPITRSSPFGLEVEQREKEVPKMPKVR